MAPESWLPPPMKAYWFLSPSSPVSRPSHLSGFLAQLTARWLRALQFIAGGFPALYAHRHPAVNRTVLDPIGSIGPMGMNSIRDEGKSFNGSSALTTGCLRCGCGVNAATVQRRTLCAGRLQSSTWLRRRDMAKYAACMYAHVWFGNGIERD